MVERRSRETTIVVVMRRKSMIIGEEGSREVQSRPEGQEEALQTLKKGFLVNLGKREAENRDLTLL